MAENVHISVLFADVCGSTRLYETLGDRQAQQVVGECIAFMLEIVEQHGGILVKTIGDEIMVRFNDANQAVRAACEIQEENESGRQYAGHRIALRAGLHHGPAILDDGDVFGDAVNVAARMASIAKAAQVITTGDTVARLDDDLAEMAREFDRTMVNGDSVELHICEILWEAEDVTTMNLPAVVRPAMDQGMLILRYERQEIRVGAGERPVVTLGRGSQADMVVRAPLASRVHCRFESRRGKFVVVDQSANGTFLHTADGESVYLRREELLIWGSGCIALGEDVTDANQHLIHFTCL